MRWIDKPRKVSRKQIVLEYIKFMKIMGYYKNLVAYMYEKSKDSGLYIHVKGEYREANVLCHKQFMISYFETELRNHCNSRLNDWVFRTYFIRYPLGIGDYEAWSLTELFSSYLRERHLNNCIIVD
jgi:hypothetical protein